MICELSFAKKTIAVNLAEDFDVQVLKPNSFQSDTGNEEEVTKALDNPISSMLIEELFEKGDTVAIVTSDITRPVPNKVILPLILERLHNAGVQRDDIVIVFALGSHRQHSSAEMSTIVGEDIYNYYHCVDSCSDGYTNMGLSSLGTPMDICKHVVRAKKRILVGNIEYHYFAGYSGGAKALMPGVSTRSAIQANHRRMVETTSCAGNIETNQLRMDIDEVLRFCSVDFIVNVVLDENKNIIKAVAGDCISAHLQGCAFLDSVYKISIEELADIVLVSAGGWPKDINVYQAQKALDNAKHAVKEDGTIILLASCKEGLGEEVFEEWLREATCSDDLICRIQHEFVLGGHKAAAIALVLQKAEIFLVSDLAEDMVKSIFVKPFENIQSAITAAIAKHGTTAKVIVMPYGSSTLPVLARR